MQDMTNRREFLKGAAWMCTAAVAAGCMSRAAGVGGIGGGEPKEHSAGTYEVSVESETL